MTHGATGSRGSNPLACGQCFVFVFSGLHRFESFGSTIGFGKLECVGSNPVALVDVW